MPVACLEVRTSGNATLIGAVVAEGFTMPAALDTDAQMPMFRGCPRAPLPVAEKLETSVIKLPSSLKLDQKIERWRAARSAL